MKRATALVLLFVMMCSLLGCQKNGQTNETDEKQETETNKSETPKAEIPSIFDTKEEEEGLKICGKVDGFEVSHALYNYCLIFEMKKLSKGDPGYFDKHPEGLEQVQKTTAEELVRLATPKLLFEKFKLKEDERFEEKFIENVEKMEKMYNAQTGKPLSDFFKEQNLTLSVYKTVFYMNELYKPAILNYLGNPENKVVSVTDEEVEKQKEEYRTVQHILLKFRKEEPKEKTLQRLEEIILKYKAGEAFADLLKKHSEDYQANGNNTYTFTYNQMVKPFEEAAFQLEVEELSAPVESQYGYHVILRKETDTEQVRSMLYTNAVQKYVLDFMNHLHFEKNEK